ncbi:L-histidine N(alpha)-methyltransferase [Microcoleus sp. F10-C6]|uniref:L-histidine N(alpha)-methyltransferase n=1 Tax=unclassified Microcoleus TaxID=2642155 RepID=UPI002FD54354
MSQYPDFGKLLEDPTDESDLGWTLCFIGDSQQTKLAELVQHLKGDFSQTGDGKQILSGFSYWGIGPTIAWDKTCADPFYPVMKDSIQSFKSRWRQIFNKIEEQDFYYVSLGVGNGKKDGHILTSLLDKQPNLFYFPVDMSAAMLRMAIQEVTGIDKLIRRHILPIQIDFCEHNKVDNLRKLIDQIVPNQPVLFSFLGNTLANFHDDLGLLKIISRLMRDKDLLLIEVAATKDLDNKTIQAAAEEYARIDSFKKFVTSALLQNTDLHIDLGNLIFQPSVEENKAILIKVIYRNSSQKTLRVMLPDWSYTDFVSNDTIRLFLTRKYTQEGIKQMISESGLAIIDRKTTSFENGATTKFGMDLLLLKHPSPRNQAGQSNDVNLPDAVWS